MKAISVLIALFVSLSVNSAYGNDVSDSGTTTSNLEASAQLVELELEEELSFSFGTTDEIPETRTSASDKDLPDFDLEKYMSGN